jgi:hypothetical protein
MDFESSAFANSATPARRSLKLRNQKRSSNASDLLNRARITMGSIARTDDAEKAILGKP